MSGGHAAAVVSCFVLAAVGTELLRRALLRSGVVDVPGARSSHTAPTPRGGGGAFVVVTTVAAVGVIGRDAPWPTLLVVVGGVAVAAIGFIDDRRHVQPAVRLAIHGAAAVCALAGVGPPGTVGGAVLSPPVAAALSVVAVVWVINLFNFMDGIDGIAGVQGVVVAIAIGVLAALAGDGALALTAWCLAAAVAGFLTRNWPPAKVFMGDVGSGWLGYAVAALVLAAARRVDADPLLGVLLTAVFVVDATATLVRRAVRGVSIVEAHRDHAYQRAVQLGRSHLAVTATVLTVDVGLAVVAVVLRGARPALLWGATAATMVCLLTVWARFAARD